MKEQNIYGNAMKPRAIYVHGLGSGAASTTIKTIRKIFTEYEWIAAEVNEAPYESIEKLNSMVHEYCPAVLMGTSLGGYYVFYTDAADAVKIICNPAMNIETIIRKKIGLGKHNYFVERENGETEFVLNEEVCNRFEEYRSSHNAMSGKVNYAVFATHDELIGASASLENMAMVFNSGYSILIDNKGGHRLRKSTLTLLKKQLNISLQPSKPLQIKQKTE